MTTTPHGSARVWVSHAPEDYACPFCEIVGDVSPFSQANLCAPTDLVYRDELVSVIVACDGFGEHAGHAMVIPSGHFEALYDLPDDVNAALAVMTRLVAVAMKRVWAPEGISTRQHNEPSGNQHVWHYHQHVFPRWAADDLYRQVRRRLPVDFRAVKARELAAALREVLEEEGRASSGIVTR